MFNIQTCWARGGAKLAGFIFKTPDAHSVPTWLILFCSSCTCCSACCCSSLKRARSSSFSWFQFFSLICSCLVRSMTALYDSARRCWCSSRSLFRAVFQSERALSVRPLPVFDSSCGEKHKLTTSGNPVIPKVPPPILVGLNFLSLKLGSWGVNILVSPPSFHSLPWGWGTFGYPILSLVKCLQEALFERV